MEKFVWAFYLLSPGLLGILLLLWKDVRSGCPHLIPEANIADHMTPRVRRHITDQSTIRVVGADCHYLEHREKWAENLRSWLERGCQIDYLVSQPSANAHGVLRDIHSEYPERFHFRDVVDLDDSISAENKKRLKELRTFHFVLFDNPRQIWIEGNHPEESLQAFDCEYVPPKRAQRDDRYEEYSDVFEATWRHLVKAESNVEGA